MNFLKWMWTTPDVNSRVVFFLQGAAVAFGIVITCYSFVHDAGNRDGYVTMVTTLLGGGSLSTVARAYGKKVSGQSSPTPDGDQK